VIALQTVRKVQVELLEQSRLLCGGFGDAAQSDLAPAGGGQDYISTCREDVALLAEISVAQIYRLRHSAGYRKQRVVYQVTRAVQVAMARWFSRGPSRWKPRTRTARTAARAPTVSSSLYASTCPEPLFNMPRQYQNTVPAVINTVATFRRKRAVSSPCRK